MRSSRMWDKPCIQGLVLVRDRKGDPDSEGKPVRTEVELGGMCQQVREHRGISRM